NSLLCAFASWRDKFSECGCVEHLKRKNLKTMRAISWLVGWITFTAVFLGGFRDSVSAQELKRLRYGTTISTVNLPVWVAKESRLFAKHGLDPEVIMIQAGALTTLAIISGELQFSGAGAASVLAARIKGSDIVLVDRNI